MNQVLAPTPVRVEIPNHFAGESNQNVTMMTTFYRGGTYPGEALYLAAKRKSGSSPLSVVSAGCSIGTEPYGVAALYEASNGLGSLDIEGYDFNQAAIEGAEEGVYKLFGYDDSERISVGQTMTDRGFAVSGEVIDAAPIRERHKIRFIEHDLTNPLPRADLADLIFANNVLQHLWHRGTVGPVVRNLGAMLADRGIISFGESSIAAIGELPEIDQASSILSDEFDMQPLLTGPSGFPVMFGRT